MQTVFLPKPQAIEAASVIASIQPQWSYKIFTFEKGLEVRKNRPKILPPFRVLAYGTKPKAGEMGLCICSETTGKMLIKDFPKNYAVDELFGWTPLDGKIIGEFTCDRIVLLDIDSVGSGFWDGEDFRYTEETDGWKTCLTREQLIAYCGEKRPYGWHITEPKLYETPIPLEKAKSRLGLEFPVNRAPQSWCYAKPRVRGL